MARSKEEQIAFDAGYQAYAEYGEPKNTNPYLHHTSNNISIDNLSEAWNGGYEVGQDDYKDYLQSQSPLREEDYNA